MTRTPDTRSVRWVGRCEETGRVAQSSQSRGCSSAIAALCGAPAREGIAGESLVPLLKEPTASWDRPAITTHGRGNHGVRTERWRYIRYADGSEELYDHSLDPQEWTNLAETPEAEKVKKDLARWLPPKDAPDAPSEKAAKKND